MIIEGVYFFLLVIASIEDYRYHRVQNRWIFAIFLLGIFRLYLEQEDRWVTITLTCICFLLFYMLYLVVRWLAKKSSQRLAFGGADVRLISAMMLVQGWDTALFGILIGLVFASVKSCICREFKKEIPLIPWITFGCIFSKKIIYFLSKT